MGERGEHGAGGRGLEAVGFDGYNQAVTGKVAKSLTAKSSDADHTHVVCYTLKIRSGCEGGGKGALIQTDKSATLSTLNDQVLFQPVAYSFDSLASNSMKSKNPHSGCRQVEIAKCLDTTDPNPCKNQGGIAVVEVVRQDPAVTSTPICMATQQGGAEIMEDKCPTITASAGMSGNNQPVVCYDARGNGEGNIVPTLTGDHENIVTDYTAIVAEHAICYPIHDQATRCSGRRGDKQDGKGNGLGIGNDGDPMNTITSGDRHAVCYAIDLQGGKGGANYAVMDNSHPGSYTGQDAFSDMLVVGAAVTYQDTVGALCARDYKGVGSQYVSEDKLVISGQQYIVRRLTPTECARLQGFPDWWGHISEKADMTYEEYRFWLDVRNNHARINGKAEKEYTKPQMLTWYNKLHTDSSEYKMWGNGIALPPALYCMQGIVEALDNQKDKTI